MAIERLSDPNPRRSFSNAGAGGWLAALPLGPLTLVLMAICVGVAIMSRLGKGAAVVDALFISTELSRNEPLALPEVARGEVWRLLTPIFLHFGIMHLIFNLLWLKDLGTMVEKRASTRLLLAIVVVSGVLSNFGQFYFDGPYFGGMSGVVYALLGFVWMKSRFDPGSGFYLDKQTVLMMMIWFGVCVAGLVGNVANYAHGFGLAIGIVGGFISAKFRGSRPPAFGY